MGGTAWIIEPYSLLYSTFDIYGKYYDAVYDAFHGLLRLISQMKTSGTPDE